MYSKNFTDAALEKLRSDPTKASEVEEFLAKKAENERRIAELEADPSFKQHDLYTKITPEMRQTARQRILDGIVDNPDIAENSQTMEFLQDGGVTTIIDTGVMGNFDLTTIDGRKKAISIVKKHYKENLQGHSAQNKELGEVKFTPASRNFYPL